MDILYSEMFQKWKEAQTIKTRLKTNYGSLMRQLEFVIYH